MDAEVDTPARPGAKVGQGEAYRAVGVGVRNVEPLQQAHATIGDLQTLSGQETVLFARERRYTNKLITILDEVTMQQEPTLGFFVLLCNELASSAEQNGGVDRETIREEFKKVRQQAGLTKPSYPGKGGWMQVLREIGCTEECNR